MGTRFAVIAAFLISASANQPARAAVMLTFLSRDFGVDFPHAFVETTGATDAQPQITVHANYGFTAKVVSPSILLSPVNGEIMSVSEGYIRGSDRHFSLKLTDAQYARFLELVDRWRSLPGRSYDLHRRNCVHFVKAVAVFAGLNVENTDGLMLKPRSFLDEVEIRNSDKVVTEKDYKPKLKESNHAIASSATK